MAIDRDTFHSFLGEFFRYIVVGGTAFLIDYAILYLTKRYVFDNLGDMGVYIATALGFIAGLVYNYILSVVFVFKGAIVEKKGRSVWTEPQETDIEEKGPPVVG